MDAETKRVTRVAANGLRVIFFSCGTSSCCFDEITAGKFIFCDLSHIHGVVVGLFIHHCHAYQPSKSDSLTIQPSCLLVAAHGAGYHEQRIIIDGGNVCCIARANGCRSPHIGRSRRHLRYGSSTAGIVCPSGLDP